MSVPAAERFWSHVTKADGDGCWTWTASCVRDGYGQFGGPGHRNVRAHRFSYELAHGPIAAGLNVLHKCDNPPCVRPDHLFLGTQKVNVADMYAKGRANRPTGDRAPARRYPASYRGERNGSAKLREEDVRRIRDEVAAGSTLVAMARLFGLSNASVGSIVRRETWRHVA